MPSKRTERRAVEAIRRRRGDLIDLLASLVALDTTARTGNEPARDEAGLQRLLRERLEAVGAQVELWEPPRADGGFCGSDGGPDFAGRPQLLAQLRGAGGGRSLLLNGHIDAVSVEPRESWQHDPFTLTIQSGRLYGRGTADMKGGIAAMVGVLEALHAAGIGLRGDVVFCTVTDEESSGAGSRAVAAHGVLTDAGLCAEPTGFDAWTACRGGLTSTITIEGRPGHADLVQKHWRDGGAVNAIEKLTFVLDGLRTLRSEWLARADCQHPLLSPSDIVPTMVTGGEWEVTYPAACRLICEITYLPAQVDEDGTGRGVEREVQHWLDAAAAADPWLAEHLLHWSWSEDVAPAEIDPRHPLVELALAAGAESGHRGRVAGLDSWHDAANFSRLAAIPTFSYGPGTTQTSHTVDEWLSEEELLDYSCALALILMRWCGVAAE